MWPSLFLACALALPPAQAFPTNGKVKSYAEFQEMQTRKQQLAVNELTNILDKLERAYWRDFYLTDRIPGPKGYQFTGKMFRRCLIYGHRSA